MCGIFKPRISVHNIGVTYPIMLYGSKVLYGDNMVTIILGVLTLRTQTCEGSSPHIYHRAQR